jgi:hypothetical protein
MNLGFLGRLGVGGGRTNDAGSQASAFFKRHLTDLPACARDCIAAAGCAVNDISCLCKPATESTISWCVATGCGTDLGKNNNVTTLQLPEERGDF